MSVTNLLLYYFYLAQESEANGAVFGVTNADGVASSSVSASGDATFGATDADGSSNLVFVASGDAIFGATNADGSSNLVIVASGDAVFGATDADGLADVQTANGATFGATDADGLAISDIVDQAPSPGGPGPGIEWYHAPYTKRPRVSFTYHTRGSGSVTAGGAARVVIRPRRVPVPKPVPKPVAKPVKHEPVVISVRATGGALTSGRAPLRTHTHQRFEAFARVVSGISTDSTVATHHHQTHALVASGGVDATGLSSVDVYTTQALDVNAECTVSASGNSSVDVTTHHELDAIASLSVHASGAASVIIVPRTVNALIVTGRCTLIAGGHAEGVGIEDRLTDEELLFLLEAA